MATEQGSLNVSPSEWAELGRRLRETREYLGVSQEFVAKETGISRPAISDIERGLRKVDSLELQRFSRLYRYPVTYFLGEDQGVATDDSTLHALARAAGDLTEQDKAEVLRFAEYLKQYGGNKGTK